MESVFYKYGHKKRFPVSYLLLELFAKSIEKYGDEAEVSEVLPPVLSALGIDPPYTEEFIAEVITDISELQESKSEKKGSGKSSGKRTFGKEFIKWFGSLDIDQTLLLLTNYDFDAAYKIYSTLPASLVDKMIDTKMGYEWTHAEAAFEAVIFGMGGSIKGGSSDPDKTTEEPKTKAEEDARLAQLKRMGFA
jgi:hypothetical protein